jgi:hypothetical protein
MNRERMNDANSAITYRKEEGRKKGRENKRRTEGQNTERRKDEEQKRKTDGRKNGMMKGRNE